MVLTQNMLKVFGKWCCIRLRKFFEEVTEKYNDKSVVYIGISTQFIIISVIFNTTSYGDAE